LNPNLREKCLLVKEKWPIVLTAIAEVCYRSDTSDADVLQRCFWYQSSCGTRVRVGLVVLELD
jgi:hypothetical protein